MVTEILSVEGMHCPKCTKRVEDAVGLLSGVESVQADFESDCCTVVFDGTSETLKAVQAAIVGEGFIVK